MKSLHRADLFQWSTFDEPRNIDFNGLLWVRPQGNVAIDPLPMTPHDEAHLAALGGVAWIIVTNSDHTRDARALADRTGAKLAAPAAERDVWPWPVDRWLADGDALVPGLIAHTLDGSKTPGELALVLEGTTLITGDLVRAHKADALHLLPDAKLTDRAAAVASLRKLSGYPLEAILVGDGWCLFHDGRARLAAVR